jgi:DNA-binding MarR family transcriptional regulator
MANTNDVKIATYQALAEFRYQIRRFVRFSEEVAHKADLEPQHHQLLLSLKGIPADELPRIAYLAERLQIRHNSAVELVDRLHKKGLIRRTHNARDRREVHVKLTPRGERLLRELTLHTRAELRSAAPALVATLRKVMARDGSRRSIARKRLTR